MKKKALVIDIEERVNLVWMVVVFWMRGGGEESLHKAGNNPHISGDVARCTRRADASPFIKINTHCSPVISPPPHSITQPYFLLVENNLYDQ